MLAPANRLFALALGAFLAATFSLGCTRTIGVPADEDDYMVESNNEAMEEEEDREAWTDINR
jgi:hypothetical protein